MIITEVELEKLLRTAEDRGYSKGWNNGFTAGKAAAQTYPSYPSYPHTYPITPATPQYDPWWKYPNVTYCNTTTSTHKY